MTSGPMPSPPMTAMRKAGIEGVSCLRYEAERRRPRGWSIEMTIYPARRANQVRRARMSGGRIVGMLCLLAPLLSGCSGASAPPKNDPLVGGGAPIPKDGAGAGAGAFAKVPDKPVPVLPAPSGATSPAALASGAAPRLDGDRDMRIPSGGDSSAAGRGQSPSGLTLGRPEPVHDVGGDRGLMPVPVVG